MKKIKQDVRQLCIALQRGELTLDDAKRLAEELEQDTIRHQHRTIVLGSILVLLSFFLAGNLIRHSRQKPPARPAMEQTKAARLSYVPKHSLPLDSLWVITYQKNAADADLKLAAATNQPLSEESVKHAAYHLIMGRQALEEHFPEEATAHLEEALAIFPQLRNVHGVLGTVYLQLNQLEPAIRHLEAAQKEGPTLTVLNNLGAALVRTGELDRAEEYLLQANELDPGYPGGLKNMALLYHKKEQPEKALTYFEDYLARHCEDVETAELYANYLTELDRRSQAIDFLANYSQQNTDHALPLYLLLAKFEAQATNTTAAVAALDRATEHISPNLALTKLNRDEFDSIRNTEEFRALVQRVELANVTLEKKR
ncbi:tetratricopeptide repeat protein [Tichowtungia aerotolerans]|uniref:Tetratricopeptide repeat protein n=1 Tax=Tichowtungia aerotolerans TaxID=2697043 RepID=A0A6P1M216_9BACT|nr:tetratricopeptide repeat protein [Tichowtungia aerotolerans]QHI68869.1 tetratricopeptide repeat protein [Tichowtungia aerotolerans]